MTGAQESFLFRGGYLLAEAGREPPPHDAELHELLASWHETRIGPYVVRCDDTWRRSHARTGDAEVLLLGTAMDLDDPGGTQDEAVRRLAAALASSDTAFLDRLDALNGAHVVFARRGSVCWALQDATAMEAMAYDVGGDAPLVASHPALIAELRGYEINELSRLWHVENPDPRAKEWKLWAGAWHLPGVKTAYEEVRALTPNTRLDIATGRVERFFPRAPIGVVGADEVVERVSGHLRDAWAWVVKEFPGTLSVSLSGGLDSRLTLAASREHAAGLHYFTYYFPGKVVHQNDLQLAQTLTGRFGLKHDSWPMHAGAALMPAQPAWKRTHGGLHGAGRIDFAWVEHFPRGRMHVRSNVLEVTRGYFLKNPRNRHDDFDARKLAGMFRNQCADPFKPYYEEYIEVTGFRPDAQQDMHFTDLYHWEQRLGRWHSELVRRSKISHTTFVLWNNRRVLTTLLARPPAERVQARAVWAMIDRLWPEVLDVPVFSGAGFAQRPAGEVAPLRPPPTRGEKGRAVLEEVARRGLRLRGGGGPAAATPPGG